MQYLLDNVAPMVMGLIRDGKVDQDEFTQHLMELIADYPNGKVIVGKENHQWEEPLLALIIRWILINVDLSIEQMDAIGVFDHHYKFNGNPWIQIIPKKLTPDMLFNFATQGQKQIPCSLEALDQILNLRPSLANRLWKFMLEVYLPKVTESCVKTLKRITPDPKEKAFKVGYNELIISGHSNQWIGRLLETGRIGYRQAYNLDKRMLYPSVVIERDLKNGEPDYNPVHTGVSSMALWLLRAPRNVCPWQYDRRFKLFMKATTKYIRGVDRYSRPEDYLTIFKESFVKFLMEDPNQLFGIINWLLANYNAGRDLYELLDGEVLYVPQPPYNCIDPNRSLFNYLLRQETLNCLSVDMLISLAFQSSTDNLFVTFVKKYEAGQVEIKQAIHFLMTIGPVRHRWNNEISPEPGKFALKIAEDSRCTESDSLELAKKYPEQPGLIAIENRILRGKVAEIGHIVDSVP